MGDFAASIGQGIAGLVGGSINALAGAFNSVWAAMQQALPGPLFPIVLIGIVVILALLFKRL